MPVEPRLVLYDGTKSISRVFSMWSRSKSIGQYQCNFEFILDHRRQTLSYFRSTLIYICLQKSRISDNAIPFYSYDTIIDLHVCKMTATQGHCKCQSSKKAIGGDASQSSA